MIPLYSMDISSDLSTVLLYAAGQGASFEFLLLLSGSGGYGPYMAPIRYGGINPRMGAKPYMNSYSDVVQRSFLNYAKPMQLLQRRTSYNRPLRCAADCITTALA
jgi:hypothetical protein